MEAINIEKYTISNRELISFLGITFGITTIMGIAMGFVYTNSSASSFPLVQMYYPAIGVIIALLLYKEKNKEQPNLFFKTYLFFSISSIIYLLVSSLILHNDSNTHLQTWLTVGSLFLIIAYNLDSKQAIENFGLKFTKNIKASIIYIFLFIVFYFLKVFTHYLQINLVLLWDHLSLFKRTLCY